MSEPKFIKLKSSDIEDPYLAAILDMRRPNKAGTFPVAYRVTYQRERAYFPAKISLTKAEAYILYKSRKKEISSKRKDIDGGFSTIEWHIKELKKKDIFSLEALKLRMKKGIKSSLTAAFDFKIRELKENKQIGTAIYYESAKKSILGAGKTDIQISKITAEWCKKYEKRMRKEGKSFTTIGMYMRALRTIMGKAKRHGIIADSQYPFNEYKIPSTKGRKLALTVSQIKKVIDYPLKIKIDLYYRDLWYFSYLCNGININDLLRLKYSDIDDDEICYRRRKTINTSRDKTDIRVTILPEMEKIIKQWGTDGDCIFPGLEKTNNPEEEHRVIQNITRAINQRMHKIGEALGFGKLSTYTARHSFATVLKRSGADISYISESLGHSDLKTTSAYLDSFEKGTRKKMAKNLTNFEEEE